MAGSMLEENLNLEIGEALRKEFPRNSSSEAEKAAIRKPPAVVTENAADVAERLPRRIPGGFGGIHLDLAARATDWKNMVRLLEQQRPDLEFAEAERDRLHHALTEVVPHVQDSGRALKSLLENTKNGDVSGDLSALFDENQKALDELEVLAQALTTNLIRVRSVWEQYARTVIRAQKMREELRG